jgi:hypothetical protein
MTFTPFIDKTIYFALNANELGDGVQRSNIEYRERSVGNPQIVSRDLATNLSLASDESRNF